MTDASYTAWDDKQYVWPPPEGWYEASDGKWWPEGYGPQPSPPAESEADVSDIEDTESAAEAETESGDDLGSSGLAFDAATDAESVLSDATGSMTDQVSDAVDDGTSGLSDAADSMVDQVSDGADGFGDRVSDAAGSAMDRASDAAGGLEESATDTATGLGDDAAGTVGDGLSDVQGMTDAVDEARSRLTDGLPDINDVMPTQEISAETMAGLGDAGDVADRAGGLLEEAAEVGGVDQFVPGELPAADVGTENVTQVVPTDLSAAPTEFAPPPPGSGPGFARPPSEAPLSPLEHPTGPPNTDLPGPGPEGGPLAGFDAPAPSGTHGDLAAPGQLPPPGADYGVAPGEVPGQPHAAAPGLGADQQAYGGPLAPDLGVDSQTILSSKAKGRSRAWLWVLLGVLALVAIGAALFLALRGDDDGTDGGEAPAIGPGSFAEPHPRSTGVVVFYPDGDVDQRWVIEVLEPVRDATPEIVSDASVAAPADGEVFGATRIRVRNESGVDGASLADLQFNAVNAGGTVIDREANPCSFSDQDLDYSASVALGTVVEGSVCWALPVEDLSGLRLGIESDKVSGRVHIDLN